MTVLIVLYIIYSALKLPKRHKNPPVRRFLSVAAKNTYIFGKNGSKRKQIHLQKARKSSTPHHHPPTKHAHTVRRHGKTTSENGIEAAKRSTQKSTRKKHTQKRGKVYKILFLVRVRVRVLSWGSATPLLKSTLIFPLFTIVPPFLCLARACVRVRVCVVWRCMVLTVYGGCNVVWECLMYIFPPCARWWTA